MGSQNTNSGSMGNMPMYVFYKNGQIPRKINLKEAAFKGFLLPRNLKYISCTGTF